MPISPSYRILFSSLLFSTVAACATVSGEDVGTQETAIQGTPTSLQDLPTVSRFTRSNDLARTTFVAGDLGQTLAPVMKGFKMANSELFLVDSARPDSFGVTVQRYEQLRNGLRVVGGDLRISKNAAGKILSASSAGWDDSAVATEAVVLAEASLAVAMAGVSGAERSTAGELVYIAPSNGTAPVLAWQHSVSGVVEGMPQLDEIFVDATTGIIVDRHPQIHSARNRSTYNAFNIEDYGTLVRSEGQSPIGNTDVDLAHTGAGITYDCLQEVFGRDSFDDRGAEMASVANFGSGFANAFWDSVDNIMVYGEGFAVADIGTHEVGHAVTTYTADMVYQNEPGALNEAWSDILAAICDKNTKGSVSSTTWSLGEEMSVGAFRFMDNPTIDNYSSDFYPERLLLPVEQDAGGVHGNSGIANLAFYLLSEGGFHPRGATSVDVIPVGIDKAGQIFYRALSTYMNTNTDFATARAATELAAEDIYGPGSSESYSVSEAWAAVGVGDAPGLRPEPEPEPEPTPEPGEGGGGGGEPGAVGDDVIGGCSTGGGQSPLIPTFFLLVAAVFLGKRRKAHK